MAYTAAIYLNPATTETICANATASGYSPSSTACNDYTRIVPPTATPSITLGSGTYAMPASTTITDPTPAASILWCHVRTGTCTPATPYTSAIRLEAFPTETICTNATSSALQPSGTACNYSYTAGDTIRFKYSDGEVTMSTPIDGAKIFYTLDGSTATEASIEYTPGHSYQGCSGDHH